jgi:alpha-D-ribose 1-methylphosphonate 5-triphosphate synthase subunit PhnG
MSIQIYQGWIMTATLPCESADRARWISALAKALPEELEQAWTDLADKPEYAALRGPEIGLVMVQARAGGNGAPFNLGEMTMTRCSVRLASGLTGHGYVAGRNPRQAELAAVFDAVAQDPASREKFLDQVLAPMLRARLGRERAQQTQAADTKVEFFTMVRGD